MINKGYSMAWAPAPNRAIPTPFNGAGRGKTLGQQKGAEHDNKFTALGVDALVAVGTAHLAYGLGSHDNRWSTFWWVVTGITAVKFLHDLSRP